MSHLRVSIIGDCLIEVEDRRVTPAAPQLFGLLLLLSLRQGKPISRQAIQTLLLADAAPSTLASHNLRQLLYRLRQMGLRVQEQSSGLALGDTETAGPMAHLQQLDAAARARLTLAQLEVLPSYLPRLPKPFSIWLDDVRNDMDGQIRQLLLEDLAMLRASHAWRDVIRLGETLASLDAANGEVVRARAEALAMSGRRGEALQVLDQFTRENTLDAAAAALLQCLRLRIAKTPIARREGTLRARASCLAFMEADWATLPSDGARLTAVVGHAGLGKTRVAEEFAARISFRGGHVVRFHCDSQSQQQPLALFSHILPALRAMRGSLGAAPEYRNALDLVRPAAESAEPIVPEGLSLEARRADIQSALIDLLEAVSAERAVLLVVDDAHLLDDASRSVLRALTTTRNAALLQILVCARPTSGNATLFAGARRTRVFELAPLSVEDSRALLLELSAAPRPDDDYVAWSVRQAAGNPFYLHTLASQPSSSSTALPFDISSLALRCYASLRGDSRTVLDTCVLLGRFATMSRAVVIAGLDDPGMLAALRDLEEQDLVHYTDGHLSGPHALLLDALRALIPSSVSALLHRRIAAALEADCVADRLNLSLAWASAQSWLAAGEPTAATHLLRRCASHAASLGEPAAGAELLSQVAIATLPLLLQGELLDDLNRFAHAGGSRLVAAAALRERLRVARELAEDADQINAHRLGIITADVHAGEPIAPAKEAVAELLADISAQPALRAAAGTMLLVLADQELDAHTAEVARLGLSSVSSFDPNTDVILARARIVYHTTFGDLDRAEALASRLLTSFPNPTMSEECVRTRSYAAFAYYRIGASSRAQAIAEADFAFATSRRWHNKALYAASLCSCIAIEAGEYSAAQLWFTRCEIAARGVDPSQLSPTAGVHCNAGILAMRQGRFDEAEARFRAPQLRSFLTSARFKAFSLAMLLRLEQLRSGKNLPSADVELLRSLFTKGRSLGSQDGIVEALWCAHMLDGETALATQLLEDYLCVHRRERSLPEWSLRDTTAADSAWQAYHARSGACAVSVKRDVA